MKWKFNPKTLQMEEVKQTGVEVTRRMGGIMVEHFDRHFQFLINFGKPRITHCVGCKPDNLHLFTYKEAIYVAERVKRIGGVDEQYFNYKTYLLNY